MAGHADEKEFDRVLEYINFGDLNSLGVVGEYIGKHHDRDLIGVVLTSYKDLRESFFKGIFVGACSTGNPDNIEFSMQYYAPSDIEIRHQCIEAINRKDEKTFNLLINQYEKIDNYDVEIAAATSTRQWDILQILLDKGGTSFDRSLISGCEDLDEHVVEMAIKYGAKNWRSAVAALDKQTLDPKDKHLYKKVKKKEKILQMLIKLAEEPEPYVLPIAPASMWGDGVGHA